MYLLLCIFVAQNVDILVLHFSQTCSIIRGFQLPGAGVQKDPQIWDGFEEGGKKSFLPISHIVCTSRHTDLFVEVTNVTKGNGIWAHFISTGCFPTQIQLSRPIQKDDVQIETVCCIFKWIRINWSNIKVTGISGTMFNMPDMAYVSIFTDNDLTHITEDHFEIKLIARLLDQMYVVQPPVFLPRYDDAPPSAPQFPEHLLTCS